MRLVERDDELLGLREFFAGCAQGARTAIVSGGVAVGKTALLTRFAELVRQDGARHLAAQPSPLHGNAPLSVVQQLLRGLPDDDGLLQRVQEGTGVADAERLPVALLRELDAALADLLGDRPTLITVDDADHADAVSLQLLYDLLGRQPQLPVLLLLAQAAAQPARAEAAAQLGIDCRRITLRPLSPSGVQALLTRDGDRATAEKAASAHRITGGNPLLTSALIRDCASSGPFWLAAGDAFRQAVYACLRRGDRLTRRTAHAAAVLHSGGPLPADLPGLLPRMLEVDEAEVTRGLQRLQATGLLDESSAIGDPTTVAAILSDLPADECSRLHARAARLLHLHGAPPASVAVHLVAAGHTGCCWRSEVLVEAAAQALDADDIDAGLRYLDFAGGCCADETHRLRVVACLARAEWRLNPATATRHLPVLLDALHNDQLGDVDTATAVRGLLWQGRVKDAAGVVDRVAAGAGVHVRSLCHVSAVLHPPLRAAVARLAEPVHPSAPGLPHDTALRAAAVLHRALAGVAHPNATRSVRWLLRQCRLSDSTVEILEAALLGLVVMEELDLAARCCDDLLDEADARGLRTCHSRLRAVRADIALRRGDALLARRLAEQTMAALAPSASAVVAGTLATLVQSSVALGDAGAAGRLLFAAPLDGVDTSLSGLRYLLARSQYYLATGQVRAALDDADRCGSLAEAWGADAPSFVAWRGEAARAHLRAGRRRQAESLLLDQLQRTGVQAHRTRSLTLSTLAQAATDAHRRARWLREAVDELRAAGDGWPPHAEPRLPDIGDKPAAPVRPPATVPLRGRRRVAHADGAADGDPQCAARHGPVGVTRISALTRSERRVAELAAGGHTNREISKRLFITVSTVEQHLTRAYRKLRVASRAALTQALAAEPEDKAS